MEKAKFTWDTFRSEILTYNSDGRTLAAGGEKTVTLWNCETGRILHNLEFDRKIQDAVFSPDGHLLAVLLEFDEVHVWETRNWRLQTRLHFRKLNDEAPYGQEFYGERLMFRADS